MSTWYRTHNLTPPCKGCSDRYGGCHAVCERYHEFYLKNEERKRKRDEEYQIEQFIWNGIHRKPWFERRD